MRRYVNDSLRVNSQSLGRLLLCWCVFTLFISFSTFPKKAQLTLNFINVANGKPLAFDSVYTTPLGEAYSLTKLKYYISNIQLPGNAPLSDAENYHLVNLANTSSLSFTIPVKEGKYEYINFMLGVDSLHNCSGAQDGALDPMNDMFWTWNSGYVMFKLEGNSPASNQEDGKVVHHLGGYRFGNNIATAIQLPCKIKVKDGETVMINIYVNLDKYWDTVNAIKIAEDPVCTLPGAVAKKIAANFKGIFSIATQ